MKIKIKCKQGISHKGTYTEIYYMAHQKHLGTNALFIQSVWDVILNQCKS